MEFLHEKQSPNISSLTFSIQALLIRHESYVKDSEQDRTALTMRIERLEGEKLELEHRNMAVIEENRQLLDQLESLNDALAESDSKVVDLQATLQSSQQEIHKLAQLAARAARLESQIAEFERDQVSWQTSLTEKDQSEKSALRRSQQAERSLAEMQRQIELIEQEAKEEKARHAEVLARMERRLAVERELHSSAARLKGAAAVRSASKDMPAPNVVSHFVRDLLQDNSALQRGILELREMLDNSNFQVEELRKQLPDQEPVAEPSEAPRQHLRHELRKASGQELHVHHHYHATPTTARPAVARRPKKKRYGSLMSGRATPPSGVSTPRSSISYGVPSTTAAILQQTAASLPASYQSTFAFPGPSSPQSTNRASSIFDPVFSDAGQDSSRPTTPGTEDPGSPTRFSLHSKRSSVSSSHVRRKPSAHRGRPSLDAIMDDSLEHLGGRSSAPIGPSSAIPEEELDWNPEPFEMHETDSGPLSDLSEDLPAANFGKTRLRRSNSHDSLLSVSGMDIHTLRSRPSQLLSSYSSRAFTTQAVLSESVAHADRPAILSQSSATGQSILSGVAAGHLQANGTRSTSLTNRLGWVFGKWGATPAPLVDDTSSRTPSIASGSDGKSMDDAQITPKAMPRLRSFGVNQSGPIPFFPPEVRAPPRPPVVNLLDQQGLEQVLND